MLSSKRETLRALQNIQNTLGRYPDNQKSAIFEHVISKSFAETLSLPFFDSSTDDPTILKKVVWNGSQHPVRKAPPGPDCLVHAYGLNCIVEPTRREGASQWTLEGCPLIRHAAEAIQRFRLDQSRTYAILVTSKIARDTFRNFHADSSGLKIVLIETDQMTKILETSLLAMSMKSMEVRGLLEEMLDCLRRDPNPDSYRHSVDRSISGWKDRVLESEKWVYVGLKALKTIRGMDRSPPIGLGELFGKMQANNWVKHYLNLIKQTLDMQLITDSLTRQGFACCDAGIYDTLVYPVMAEDFISRATRINEQVKMVGFC